MRDVAMWQHQGVETALPEAQYTAADDDAASTGAASACALTWHDLPQLTSAPALHVNTGERLRGDARERLKTCDSARDAHSVAGSCASTRVSCAGWSRFQQACAGPKDEPQPDGGAHPEACPHCAREGPWRCSSCSFALDTRRCSSACAAPPQRPAPSAPAELQTQQGRPSSAPGPAAPHLTERTSVTDLPCSLSASIGAGRKGGMHDAARPLSPRTRWQSSCSERGAPHAVSPPPPWRRERRLSSAESAASTGRCRRAESRTASITGDVHGGRRHGGMGRGEGGRAVEQRGLPGGALMVSGPRAAVAGPQIWVAVGPGMRPLPLLDTPHADADGPAGRAAHPRAAEAVRLCLTCLQLCCQRKLSGAVPAVRTHIQRTHGSVYKDDAQVRSMAVHRLHGVALHFCRALGRWWLTQCTSRDVVHAVGYSLTDDADPSIL